MSNADEFGDLDNAVISELRTARLRVQPPLAAERLWTRVLTQSEREQLGDDFSAAYQQLGTVGMYMAVRHVAFLRALIEVTEHLGFFDQATAQWLLREISDEPPRTDRPYWDAAAGELRVGDQVICRISVRQRQSNVQKIVEAFQAAHWCRRVDNPLSLGQQQLNDAVWYFNSKVDLIRFHAREGGEAVTWEWR